MFSCQAFATTARLDPSVVVLSESKNILALPALAHGELYSPGLVFVGMRQEQVPMRLVIFAGGDQKDAIGSLALLKLLVDLDLAPLLAHDYALFCYLSIPRQVESYRNFERWDVRWGKRPLPEELLATDADGFICIHTNDSVGGLQIEASDRTIANEVAWPAVARASRIQALDSEPVRCVPDAGAMLESEGLPANAFKLAIRTPWVAEPESQIGAIGIALKEILSQYRSLRNFAKAL
jgi:hypothetical protein